jgi:hypothetical protein
VNVFGGGVPPTIPALVETAAAAYGDAEAVVDGSRRVSFNQLADLVHAAAG